MRWLLAALATVVLTSAAPAPAPDGLEKIQHVVIIMQENHSFDSYFGTYPGADGIPMKNGVPTVCVPDPQGGCVRPHHVSADRDAGGPHDFENAVGDIDGGKMDGFVRQARAVPACRVADDPQCTPNAALDVMTYHDLRELPNYWAYAHAFVLQDHLFAQTSGWSLPAHLYEVSEWSANCPTLDNSMSCNNANGADLPRDFSPQAAKQKPGRPNYAWTDLTFLLHKNHVSWAYYIMGGEEPDCRDDGINCPSFAQSAQTPGIWNPLPSFTTVRRDGELGNIKDMPNLFNDLATGSFPSVVWLAPSNRYSEHPPANDSAGQAYVTGVVNAIMRSRYWSSTAIFISWDDWGGFYDHVPPPRVDNQGYGIRVPGLLLSPYAKRGYIDHQVLSHDAYAKFIEDVFLHGQRLDPRTDGRPDKRPVVRESSRVLGDLRTEFDFTQTPRPPYILPGGVQPPYKTGAWGGP